MGPDLLTSSQHHPYMFFTILHSTSSSSPFLSFWLGSIASGGGGGEGGKFMADFFNLRPSGPAKGVSYSERWKLDIASLKSGQTCSFPFSQKHCVFQSITSLNNAFDFRGKTFFLLFMSSMEPLLTFLFPTKQEKTTKRPAGWT